MNFHNTSGPYMRPVIQIGVGQRSLGQKRGRLLTDIAIWRPVGKVLLVLLPLVLAVNMYVSSYLSKVNESIIVVDNKRHELMDKNIELRAVKARLRGTEQFHQLAAEKLSLFAHTKGQVGRYNYKKGYFIYF